VDSGWYLPLSSPANDDSNFVDPNGEPVKPDLNIVRVNLDGTFYTWKLAVHYFRQQPDSDDRDRCFIITGSMVAWIDSPVSCKKFSHLFDSYFCANARRVIGNIQRLNTACAVLCEQHADQALNKVFESITLRPAGSRAPFALQNTRNP
jgi:hypothetical protein